MVKIQKAWNKTSVYSVHRGDEYLGYIYAVDPRAWANVFDSDDNWLASVRGHDKIAKGGEILDSLITRGFTISDCLARIKA